MSTEFVHIGGRPLCIFQLAGTARSGDGVLGELLNDWSSNWLSKRCEWRELWTRRGTNM